MRIIAGEFRSRVLKAPQGATTRPTTDRARESLFNVLKNQIDITGIRVLDLYAGSGAFSFEAISRGAAHATLVERDRNALSAIKDNTEHLGAQKKVTIVNADVIAFLRRPNPEAFDVIFSDAPYDDERAKREVPRLLQDWLADGGIRVIEHRSNDTVFLPDEMKATRELKVGEATFTIF